MITTTPRSIFTLKPTSFQRKLKSFLIPALIFLLSFQKLFATTYTSVATGNWGTAATWSPAAVPGSTDNVIIHGGNVVTVNGIYTCNNLTIGDATPGVTTVVATAANSLTINGACSINPNNINNTYTLNAGPGAVSIAGTFAWGTAGTNTVTASTGTITFTPAVTISVTNQVVSLTGAGIINFNSNFTDNYNKFTPFAGATVNFAGNYTVSTTAANWAGKGTAVFSGTGTITANSNLTLNAFQTAASASTTLATAAGTVVIGGAITLGNGSTFTGNENFEVNGNWTNNGGTFNGGSNTVTLNGTTTIAGTSSTTFPNLQLGNLTSTITVAVIVSINTTCSGITYTGYNRNRTITITTGDALTVNGNVLINQPSAAGTNSFAVNGGTCSITGNLTFSGVTTTAAFVTSVAVTTGSLTVSGNITYAADATMANQVITLTSTGSITFGNPLTVAYGTLSSTSTGTMNFNGSAPSLAFGGTGTPVFTSSTGTFNFANGITTNTTALVLNAGSNTVFTGTGTVTPNAAITFGNVQVSSGSTVTLAGNINVAGNWTNNGGTLTGGSNTVYLMGNGKTIGGTVSTAFPNLQVGSASTIATAAYSLTYTGSCTSLTLYNGGFANNFTVNAAQTLTVSGNAVINQPTAAVTNTLTVTGTCNVGGNLSLPGAIATAAYIAKVAVGASPASLTITGNTTYGSNTTPANAVITVSTGTITFNGTVNQASGTLTYTGAGNIYFNGIAPSYTFGGANAPVFTTAANCNLYFANGITNNTNSVTLNGTCNTYFTGTGTITPLALITFGNVTLNTGSATTLAGNIGVAGNWAGNGGTLSSGADTIFLMGNGKTIGGTASTAFPVLQAGSPLTIATVAYSLTHAASCISLIIYGGAYANTFTINAAQTLTTTSDVTINQPTAALTNNLTVTGICSIGGNLNLPGTAAPTGYIAKVTVGTSPASLTVAGSTTYGNNTTPANAVITVSTGTITFNGPVNQTSGSLIYTGVGYMHFNGAAPSYTFGGANAPVFTTVAACNLYFAHGLINNTNVLTLNTTSNTYFTSTGTITATAAVTFGNVLLSLGSTTTLAGNINLAGNWTGNGGTLIGGNYTVFLTGNGKTIGGTASTTFPILQAGSASTVAAVAYTLTYNATCTSLILYGGAYTNTFTINAGQTLTTTNDVTINQPTAALTNNLTINGTCNTGGNLNLPGITTTAAYIAKVTVGASPAALTVTGNVVYGSNTTPANAVITLSTGTITFSGDVNLTSGSLIYTSTGTMNFNGPSPSFSYGGANAPVFTTFNACNINVLHGITTNTALVLNAGSNTTFTGAGSLNPVANATFGKLTVNASDTLLSGATVIVAGNFTLASGSLFYAKQNFEANANWINNGGNLSGTTYTVFLNGAAQTISGSATTFQTLEIGNTTSAVNAAVTMSCNTNCTSFIFEAGNNSRTFTISAGDTLNVSGNLTVNQPTAAVTNNLAVNTGVCIVNGGLSFVGTSNTTTQVSRVSVTTGNFSVAGTVSFMANTAVATEIISVTTGTLTFGTSLTMGTGTGELLVSSSGTVNFNGAVAPSFNFGGAATAPIFTTTNGCTLNFYTGFTNNTAALTLAATSTAVFTGTGTVTSSAAITFGHVQISPSGKLTLGGAIGVRGNWTDNGVFIPAGYLVTFNGASPTTQIITAPIGENFYQLTAGVAGSTIQLNNNIKITNQLNMTGHYFNLNGYTLTLGNGSGAALSRTASQAYGGTFTRYIPAATAITANSGSYYGLFPIGTSTNYNPIAITSTVNATTGGYLSAVFTSSSSVDLVTYTDNEGAAIQVIGDMNSSLTNSGLAGGTYTLAATYNGFANSGVITDLKLETYTGGIMGSAGTTVITTGTVPNPKVTRSGLTVAQLANVWVVGSKNISNTPLQQFYYSRTSGNWDGLTTWSYTAGGSGAACSCIPPANANVTISAGQTVTVDITASADYITISNGATLLDSPLITLTGNKAVSVLGTGKTVNSSTWNFPGTMNFSASSTYTSTGSVTIGGSAVLPSGSTFTQTSGTLSLGADATINGTVTLGSGNLALTGVGNNISGTGSVLTTGSGTVSITNGKTILAGSNLTFGSAGSNLSVALSGSQNVTNYGTVTINGDLTGTAAGSTFINESGAVLQVTGNLLSTGSLSAENSPNTVVYNGSGSQTINPSTAGYVSLTVSNAGVKSLSANTTVATNLTIQNNAILNEGSNILSGSANVYMNNNSELKMTRSTSGTYPELTGALSFTGGIVTINQTAGTALLPSVAYNTLNLTGASTYDLSGVSTISNSLYVQGSSAIINNPSTLNIADSLVYASTATSTLANNITIGSFTQSAGTLSDGGYNINLTAPAGWNNNGGTFNSTGTVQFSGSAAQSISGTTATTFNNLTMNNGLGVTLNQNATVSNQLNLTNGVLYSSATAMLTMSPGTGFSGGSVSSYVSGPLAKVGSDDFIFPIGKAGIYGQAGISGLTDSTTQVIGEYFKTNYPAAMTMSGLTQVSIEEYWTIERYVTSDSMRIQLFWTNATASDIIDCDYLTVAHYTGGQWTNEQASAVTGSVCSGSGGGSVLTDGYVTSFSPFTFGGDGGTALPIKLVTFNAAAEVNTVVTKWETAMEINNAYFTIERSQDGENFSPIGTIKGADNSTGLLDYQFTDESPLKEVSYYRLRQTDNNGNSTLSNIVPVSFASQGPLSVYPNPATDKVFINIPNPAEEISLSIYDLAGHQVLNKTFRSDLNSADQLISIPVEGNLQAGLYVVSVASGENEYNQKLIVK